MQYLCNFAADFHTRNLSTNNNTMPRTNKQIDIAFDLVKNTNANIFLSGRAQLGKSTEIYEDTVCMWD